MNLLSKPLLRIIWSLGMQKVIGMMEILKDGSHTYTCNEIKISFYIDRHYIVEYSEGDARSIPR